MEEQIPEEIVKDRFNRLLQEVQRISAEKAGRLTGQTLPVLIEEINERGTTVLVVTHNKDIVNTMKKRVVTMHEGVIVSDEKEGGYHEA